MLFTEHLLIQGLLSTIKSFACYGVIILIFQMKYQLLQKVKCVDQEPHLLSDNAQI